MYGRAKDGDRRLSIRLYEAVPSRIPFARENTGSRNIPLRRCDRRSDTHHRPGRSYRIRGRENRDQERQAWATGPKRLGKTAGFPEPSRSRFRCLVLRVYLVRSFSIRVGSTPIRTRRRGSFPRILRTSAIANSSLVKVRCAPYGMERNRIGGPAGTPVGSGPIIKKCC